tara:strand:+ start:125 stop:439 length:315 start_codon:yes stop_codon:yes gene_type:complete
MGRDKNCWIWVIIVGLISYILGRLEIGGRDILNLMKVLLFLIVSYYVGDNLRKGDNKYIRKRRNDDLISKVYFTMLGSLILIVLYYLAKYIYNNRLIPGSNDED